MRESREGSSVLYKPCQSIAKDGADEPPGTYEQNVDESRSHTAYWISLRAG